MDIHVEVNDVNIDDYVTSCDRVPIVMRNRNWSPIFKGFNISVSSAIPNIPVKGQLVLVKESSNYHFQGFISKVNFKNSNSTYEIEVKHFLENLEQYQIQYSDLHSDLVKGSIESSAVWEAVTIDIANDYVVLTAHGLSDGAKIQFRNTTGNLPEPIVDGVIYYVKVVDANNFCIYKDYADYKCLSANLTTNRKVNITTAGTGTTEFTDDIDFNKYNDWSFFRDIPVSLIDYGNSEFGSRLNPDTYRWPIINYSNTVFNASIIEFDTDGTLPSPLSKNRAYIASCDVAADEGFVVYNSQADYESNTKISLSSAGSGNHYISIIKQFDNDTLPTYPNAIIQLKHLITTLFAKIGVILVTTNIDSIIFYRYTTEFQSYGWDDIYLREDMLYSLNQSQPLHYSEVEKGNLVNALDFIIRIFGMLGIQAKFTGDFENKQFTLYSQKRTSVGVIDPENEAQYTGISPRTTFDEQNLESDNKGWTFNRPLPIYPKQIPGVGLCFLCNDVLRPTSYSFNKDGEEISGSGREDISFWSCLVFFLRDLFETNGAYNVYMLRDGFFGKEFFDWGYNIIPYSPSQNDKYALEDYTRQEIESNNGIDQGVWSVREVHIEVAKDRIYIVQELIDL